LLKLRIVVALLTAGLGSAVLEAQSNPSAVLLMLSKSDLFVSTLNGPELVKQPDGLAWVARR